MSKYFGSGIKLSTGFDVSAQRPLDSRQVVADIAERDAIPAVQKYEGMIVYVEATKLTYQLIDGVWNVFGTNSDTVIENLAAVATSGDYNDLINKPINQIAVTDNATEAPSGELIGIWLDCN